MSKPEQRPALPELPTALLGQLKVKSRARRAALEKMPTVRRATRNDLLPPLNLVVLPIGDIRTPSRLVRAVDPAHARETADSIATFGFSIPVVVDADGVLLDGIVRLEAARLLALPEIPCIRVEHLSSAERRTLRLALNRLGEKGSWNLDELRLEFAELALLDAPLEVTGFSLDEIDHIILDLDAGAVEPGDPEPDEEGRPVAEIGDCFELGAHRLVCGDATKPEVIAAVMGSDGGAQLVLTDVPYNVPIKGNVTSGRHREFVMASGEMSAEAFAGFNKAWMTEANSHLREGGMLATFIDWRGYPTIAAAAASLGLDPMNLVVWAKTNAGMGSLYRSQHELLPLYKKGGAPHVNNVRLGAKGRWRSNLWTYPGASSLGSDARRGLQEHPTVKPVAMLEDALLDLTNRGDIVLDPFLGSGSTLIAAERAGRICRGVELDPSYVDVVIRRFQEVAGRAAILARTGETFDEVARRKGSEVCDQNG